MGSLRYPCAALAVGALLLAGTAGAHEFECEKKVNGGALLNITSYPTTVTWDLKITNTHPTHASTALKVKDALLEGLGFVFSPAAPITLQVGEYQTWQFQHEIGSKAQCDALAALDGLEDAHIDNYFKVKWDVGMDICTVRVTCGEPPPPPPPAQVTRTLGFFKSHLMPLQACLDVGAIDLGPGFALIDTLEEALGLLWGDPPYFWDGTKRNELEKARFLLARQTLVAVCNTRLFEAEPSPSTLIDDALAALAGYDCSDMLALAWAVDMFNNSGTGEQFPEAMTKGPSTPQDAQDLAVDPSLQTGGSCSNE
jgi:hypothetical protein